MRDIMQYPLHYEERVSIIRNFANQNIGPKTEEENRKAMLIIIALCSGDRSAVPEELKHLARIPYEHAK